MYMGQVGSASWLQGQINENLVNTLQSNGMLYSMVLVNAFIKHACSECSS